MPATKYIEAHVLGATGTRDGKRIGADISVPGTTVLFKVSLGGFNVYTNGEVWYQPDTWLDHGFIRLITGIQPHMRGLVKSAISAYLAGRGNCVTCTGSRMRVSTKPTVVWAEGPLVDLRPEASV